MFLYCTGLGNWVLVQQGLGFPILQIHVYMRVVVMILVARGEEAGVR